MAAQSKTKPPVAAGKDYIIEISGLGHSGEGVGRYQGFTIFVPMAIPGEQVKVTIIEVKKNYAKAELREVVVPAGSRVRPVCSVYESCGGCQLQHMGYSEQLAWKRQVVADAIARIAKLDGVIIHNTLGVAEPWHYRNKMQMPVGWHNDRFVAGCFARGTHDIIDTERCHIQHALNNRIVAEVKEILGNIGLSAYDERTGTGLIRHIMGRVGVKTGEVMVVLVTNGREIPHKEELIAALRGRIPGVVSIVQNINTRNTNIILGDETVLLWGQEAITDYIGPFAFKISARSFFQVNTSQAEVLYQKALDYAGLTGQETVIDAYCGAGTITLFLAQKAKAAYGIEVVSEAIENAKENARCNQVSNVEFLAGDVVDLMPRLYERGIRPDVVVVDPPRAGCDPKVLDTFAQMAPRRIIYVSCNPSSLARDLAYLEQLGYKTLEIAPVDMFPQTSHVECVALIEKV